MNGFTGRHHDQSINDLIKWSWLTLRPRQTVKISDVKGSVADQDLDPDLVGFGLFGSPGSGSGKIPDPDPLSTKRTL